jgi:hypothetical protein
MNFCEFTLMKNVRNETSQTVFEDHDVSTVSELKWNGIKNGDLIGNCPDLQVGD